MLDDCRTPMALGNAWHTISGWNLTVLNHVKLQLLIDNATQPEMGRHVRSAQCALSLADE